MKHRVLILRHAERADEAGEPWPDEATAPHNPPLSAKGWEQARAAGAALAAATSTPITHLAVSPFLRCLQTAAGVLDGLEGKGAAGVKVEVDPGLSEILGPPFLPPGTPWRQGDDTWVWAGGSPEAALRAAGLPAATPVVGPSSPGPWPHLDHLPERLEAAHSRYDFAIANAAARAAADGSRASCTLLLITHGEGVRRAVTRVAPTACVYQVNHCGWVACEWTRGNGGDGAGDDGDDDGNDPGEWALLPDESAGVAWL